MSAEHGDMDIVSDMTSYVFAWRSVLHIMIIIIVRIKINVQ